MSNHAWLRTLGPRQTNTAAAQAAAMSTPQGRLSDAEHSHRAAIASFSERTSGLQWTAVSCAT